jgi:hypothetical protein
MSSPTNLVSLPAPTCKGKPCPRCGNTTRTYRVGASVTISWRVWSEQYRFLLDTAKKLRDQGHHEAAIVTAQTACEVCTEVVLSAMLHASGIEEYVADLITGPLPNYNLLSKRVQKVYEAFSEDKIRWGEPLWQSFRTHVVRRNDIVHQGRQATPQEANDSIAAAEAVIGHLLANRPD